MSAGEGIREVTLRRVREEFGDAEADTLAALSPPCAEVSHAGSRRPTLVLATVCTGTYDWTALAESREAADSQLLAAYAVHVAQQRGFANPNAMAGVIADGDVNYHDVTPGVVLRDGSPVPLEPPPVAGYSDDAEIKALRAEWDEAFAALRVTGLEFDAADPIAARYRAASDAVNHANRKRDHAIATNTPYVPRPDAPQAPPRSGSTCTACGAPAVVTQVRDAGPYTLCNHCGAEPPTPGDLRPGRLDT